MKLRIKDALLSTLPLFLGLFIVGPALVYFAPFASADAPQVGHAPGIPGFLAKELQDRENAPLEVALVFGRAQGCSNATPELIKLVAEEAMNAGVPPKILAATVGVESQCTTLAISKVGALGLTQVMPKIWNKEFDFSERYNLLNPRDNVHVGARIMGGLIRAHGLQNGIQRYNGLGVGCDTCDAGYSARIIALAGK